MHLAFKLTSPAWFAVNAALLDSSSSAGLLRCSGPVESVSRAHAVDYDGVVAEAEPYKEGQRERKCKWLPVEEG